jgi:hypothetical protein
MDRKEKAIRDARQWLYTTIPALDTRTSLQRGIDTVRARVEDVTEDGWEPDQSFWIAFSFGVGLAAAAILTLFWWQRRFQRQEDDELFQLASESENESSDTGERVVGGEIFVIGGDGVARQGGDSIAESEVDGQDEVSTQDGVEEIVDQATNAAFFGVVDSRRYYPLETPLDQLTAENGEVADIVYFASEDEAQSQGYTLSSQE